MNQADRTEAARQALQAATSNQDAMLRTAGLNLQAGTTNQDALLRSQRLDT